MIDRFVLLIGAMKAGTTALYRYLEQHPEIAPSRDKEPEVLSNPEFHPALMPKYLEQWDWIAGRHRWALEASTGYTKMPVRPSAALPAFALRRECGAEFRFLYMVRDPIARIRSHYLHALAEGWLERGIREEFNPRPLLFSNYHFQLAPYLAAHERQRIHVMSYEDFQRRPLEVARGVARFLEIDASFEFHDTGPQNSSEHFRAKLLGRLINRSGVLREPLDLAACAQRPYRELRTVLGALLEGCGSSRSVAEFERELDEAITPTPELVQRIHECLDRDLERFRDDWGIDVWKTESTKAWSDVLAPREPSAAARSAWLSHA
ncbi:MAG: sulfotransferase domain-containing protein [Planctomycetes bacterium]|nr:sulfotransferase domain-containing protein [Planctomycetota bacterium]